MRSKYGTFLNTSLDDLGNLVTPKGWRVVWGQRRALEILERNVTPVSNVIGEPFAGKRNLRPTMGSAAICLMTSCC